MDEYLREVRLANLRSGNLVGVVQSQLLLGVILLDLGSVIGVILELQKQTILGISFSIGQFQKRVSQRLMMDTISSPYFLVPLIFTVQ